MVSESYFGGMKDVYVFSLYVYTCYSLGGRVCTVWQTRSRDLKPRMGAAHLLIEDLSFIQ